MNKNLAFIHKRNRVFNLVLAAVFTLGLCIELSTRQESKALVLFSISIVLFYSLYLFAVRRGVLIKPTMYFISTYIIFFSTLTMTGDPNIVFYIASLMLFSFISFYENLWLSSISGVILFGMSASALASKEHYIFTPEINALPDIKVFLIITALIYICLVIQNAVSKRTRFELYESERVISELAYNDALTGLPNRRAFAGEIGSKLEKAVARSFKLAVFFIDMDKFKSINDTYGHDAGDALLISVATRMQETVVKRGICARLGGDEFTILMHEDVTQDSVEALAAAVLKALQPPFAAIVEGVLIELDSTPSIGVSIFPDDAVTVTDLIKTADEAMYVAKQSGKNNFKFYGKTHPKKEA